MANLTLAGSLLLILWGVVVFCSSLYWGMRSWRSAPAEMRRHFQTHRPRNWERWPVFSHLWRFQDSHAARYLWQYRLLSIPMGISGLTAVGVGAVALFRAVGC